MSRLTVPGRKFVAKFVIFLQCKSDRRMVEQELADTNEIPQRPDLIEPGTLSADMDEMASEAGMSEEKAQRAMIDAARLADELRAE